MKFFWNRERHAMVAWEIYQSGRVFFRGNSDISYRASDRAQVRDEVQRSVAAYASDKLGETVDPVRVHITGFFVIP